MDKDDILREAGSDAELHAPKRSRAADWPLKTSAQTATSDNDALKVDQRHDKRSSSTSIRPSKFCEGSMNDRASKRPPSLFTREEEAMEEYARSQGQGQDTRMDMNYDAGIEANKASSVFRFGKAIANAFKPLTAWPGINGMWKEKEKPSNISPEKKIMEERQARAVEAYAELKKSGYRGTQALSHREIQKVPVIKPQESEHQPDTSFRDSGIDMDCGQPLREHHPNDQLIGSTDLLHVPPPVKGRSASPFSDISSARKSSLHIRKPSLQGLKKVASQIHISPAKRQPDNHTSTPIESNYPTESAAASSSAQPLRKEPSKRDMARQYKLGKKVSDLENKLETARRELELSISSAPPVPELPAHVARKPFKPGNLPSLPSERNMSPQKDDPAPPMPQIDYASFGKNSEKPAKKRSTGQIAHEAQIFKPGTEISNVLDLESAKGTKRTAKSSTKLRESKSETPLGIHKRLPRAPPKTPKNSPLQIKENVPPVPTAPPQLLATSQDPQTITSSKITNHTSISHLNRAPSPFLGPPVSASPVRTHSKSSRHGTSPPPPSLASAKKPITDLNDNYVVDTPTAKVESPVLGGESPVALSPSKVLEEGSGDPVKRADVAFNKTLVETTTEEFEWDEDVF